MKSNELTINSNISFTDDIKNRIKITINPNTPFSKEVKIGIVIAGGSGRLLAYILTDFLEYFVNHCCDKTFDKKITLYFDEKLRDKNQPPTKKTYSSYALLKKRSANNDYLTEVLLEDEAKKLKDVDSGYRMKVISEKEATGLKTLYQSWYDEGIDVIFRTSVNAEGLYQFRAETGAIKEILVSQQQFVHTNQSQREVKVLMIRDQMQGFYTNDSYELNDNTKPTSITYNGHFSKANFEQLIKFAKKRGKKRLKKGFNIWVSYKFHLFGNIMEQWIKEIDPTIEVYQPDTGFTKLFAYLRKQKNNKGKDLLFIAGNEIGDLMYEPMIEILKSTGSKLELYSKSFFLNFPNPSKEGYLCELQTVHGSADDLIDKEKSEHILPYATLRIASNIIENQLGIQGFMRIMDKAVAKVQLKAALMENQNQDKSKIAFGCSKIVSAIKEEVKLLHINKK